MYHKEKSANKLLSLCARGTLGIILMLSCVSAHAMKVHSVLEHTVFELVRTRLITGKPPKSTLISNTHFSNFALCKGSAPISTFLARGSLTDGYTKAATVKIFPLATHIMLAHLAMTAPNIPVAHENFSSIAEHHDAPQCFPTKGRKSKKAKTPEKHSANRKKQNSCKYPQIRELRSTHSALPKSSTIKTAFDLIKQSPKMAQCPKPTPIEAAMEDELMFDCGDALSCLREDDADDMYAYRKESGRKKHARKQLFKNKRRAGRR